MSYIENPKTLADLQQNIEFQLSNVQGWIGVNNYEMSLIKARCLVRAIECLLDAKESEPINTHTNDTTNH